MKILKKIGLIRHFNLEIDCSETELIDRITNLQNEKKKLFVWNNKLKENKKILNSTQISGDDIVVDKDISFDPFKGRGVLNAKLIPQNNKTGINGLIKGKFSDFVFTALAYFLLLLGVLLLNYFRLAELKWIGTFGIFILAVMIGQVFLMRKHTKELELELISWFRDLTGSGKN
jgi:hypothetical protein